MSLTDPNTLLEKMGAKVGKRKIMVTVIGTKARMRLPDGTFSRLVDMSPDGCEAMVVYTTGGGYAAPSEQDKAAILKFWKANPLAPDTYTWIEGSEPMLKIPKSKPKSNHKQENDSHGNPQVWK
jgi:hypothetical protein